MGVRVPPGRLSEADGAQVLVAASPALTRVVRVQVTRHGPYSGQADLPPLEHMPGPGTAPLNACPDADTGDLVEVPADLRQPGGPLQQVQAIGPTIDFVGPGTRVV